MPLDNNVASWTSAQLLSDVRRTARIPTGSIDWSDSVLLRECSDVIWSLAGWALQQAGDGRLSFSFDRSVAAALSGPYRAGGEFLLPHDAVGDTLQDAAWVDSVGREYPLEQINIGSQPELAGDPTQTGQPRAYAFLEGRIRVYPKPSAAGVLRFVYQRRHPELCADSTTNAPAVNSVADLGTGYTRFTLASSSPFAVGQYVDLINNQYPYRTLFTNLYANATAGSTVDLYVPHSYVSSWDISQMRLVRAGQSPYVSIPLEMRACLREKCAANILRQAGDYVAASASEQVASSEMSRVLQILSPRSKTDRQKIRNASSLLRTSGGRRRTKLPGIKETW